MKNFISANLMGGLGNQLFQISKAYVEALKTNRPALFLLKKNDWRKVLSPFSYQNTIYRKLKFTQRSKEYVTIEENDFSYKPLEPLESASLFWGYYQSSKHLENYKSEIQQLFAVPALLKWWFSIKYPAVFKPNSVAVHIRRGDYLNFPEKHAVLSMDYFFKAIEKFPERSQIIIFSDDKAFVKKHWKLDEQPIWVNERFDFLELWLMSLCNHQIISNSSFSWWGSFLNVRTNKRVIAPSEWFGPQGCDATDIYEENWELINVTYQKGQLLPNE